MKIVGGFLFLLGIAIVVRVTALAIDPTILPGWLLPAQMGSNLPYLCKAEIVVGIWAILSGTLPFWACNR